jgi:hypothetical protein
MKWYVWPFIIYWFIHLTIGVGAGYGALQLWQSRRNPFIRRVAFYLFALALDAVSTIVLIFIARGVKFTWKFTTVMFAFTLVEDLMRLPLLIYLVRGQKNEIILPTPSSGDLPPEHWEERFNRLEQLIQGETTMPEKDKDDERRQGEQSPKRETPQPQGPKPDDSPQPQPQGDVPSPGKTGGG